MGASYSPAFIPDYDINRLGDVPTVQLLGDYEFLLNQQRGRCKRYIDPQKRRYFDDAWRCVEPIKRELIARGALDCGRR